MSTIPRDVFRLVSLRQAQQAAAPNNPDSPRPVRHDPRRTQAAAFAERQRHPSSARNARLNGLKKQYLAVTRKILDLEQIQVHVHAASMQEQRLAVANSAVNSEIALHRNPDGSAIVSTDADGIARLHDSVIARLSSGQAELYRDVIARRPALFDVSEVFGGLSTEVEVIRANELCAEIRALEESAVDELPMVTGSTGGKPFVVAAGYGELIVATETLIGYAAREIAHIENVLPGESKVREHSRFSKSEEVVESETTTEKESEKDLQTTDRFELQSDSQETINRDFAVRAGVNVSAKYGLTQVDTSLDAAFSQSASQSRSSSVETAREVVAKSLERTLERVRKLKRLTITEEIRELNRHEIKNIMGPPPPEGLSGMYLWVEKLQRVQLRHYGTRMMLEFYIPEPAMSLLGGEAAQRKRRLPPFDLSPADVQPGNYLCLAKTYVASDVHPPPALFVRVGYSWAPATDEAAEQWGQDNFSDTIALPEGYAPQSATVSWSTDSTMGNFSLAFVLGGVAETSTKIYINPTYSVMLTLSGHEWPQGVPVSGCVKGHWDKTFHLQVMLSCIRTENALNNWRLRTWEALRAGYEALESKLAQEEKRAAFAAGVGVAISGRPAAVNRQVERRELQKWAVKCMRLVPQNFNSVELVAGEPELSPQHAELEAPVVRFFENSFEWDHMSYFLYPYLWARRESWRMRMNVQDTDPQFRAFLEAGAARVIVPVTPGYEEKVLQYIDPESTADELTRILADAGSSQPSATNPFRDVWIELLTDRKADVARGSGTLSVENGEAEVTINPDSLWNATDKDVGRELHIAGERYTVAARIDARTLKLDRDYTGADDEQAAYAAGSVPFGPAWTVNIPTSLVVLADNVPALVNV